MEEKIYTIPVNEAFDVDCECPLCYLKKKLESEAVDYALGSAMMEVDYRIASNESGYCNHHYSMLFEKKNKLSLALVLDTHLEEFRRKIDGLKNSIDSIDNEKKSLFRKKTEFSPDEVDRTVSGVVNSCLICGKLSSTMRRYIRVMFYLWENDEAFATKFSNSKGFCIPHFNILVKSAYEHLSRKKAGEFVKGLYEKQIGELERLQAEIHKFTEMFDYRNKDAKWGSEVDAPVRCIEKLSGYIR